jgi:uncharacterized protein (DUF1697 family)
MPASWVLLLRAVNVAGTRMAMAELRSLLEGLALGDVRTYVQSGNAVFVSPSRRRDGLETQIEAAIERVLELRVTALVRSAAEMAAIATNHPYDGADAAHRYVTFLKTEPDPEGVASLIAEVQPPDRVWLSGRQAYLLIPGGYSRTRLGNELLERRLATRATTRNWRTVTALADLAAAKVAG